jgi:hypothetical protein
MSNVTGCESCGRQVAPTLAFKRWEAVVPCMVTDSDGTKRKSLRPVFGPERDLCLPCYRAAVRADLLRVIR